MKIAFDIDDILANFMPSLLKFASPILNREYTEAEMSFETHYGEVWNVELEKAIEIVAEFYKSEEFKNIEPNPQALGLIKALKNRKIEIIAITSRPDFIKDLTLNWLETNFPATFNENNVYFTNRFYGEKQTKGMICKKLNVDYLIEDDIKHVNSCIENQKKTILLNKPWNQKFKGNDSLVTRVDSLNEILDLI